MGSECQVSEYSLELDVPGGHTTEVYHGSDLECTVSDLLPGSTYHFRVRALNDGGVSDSVFCFMQIHTPRIISCVFSVLSLYSFVYLNGY